MRSQQGLATPGREVEIRAQAHPVAHGDQDVPDDLDFWPWVREQTGAHGWVSFCCGGLRLPAVLKDCQRGVAEEG